MQWRTKATRSSTAMPSSTWYTATEQQPVERIRSGVDQGRRRPIILANAQPAPHPPQAETAPHHANRHRRQPRLGRVLIAEAPQPGGRREKDVLDHVVQIRHARIQPQHDGGHIARVAPVDLLERERLLRRAGAPARRAARASCFWKPDPSPLSVRSLETGSGKDARKARTIPESPRPGWRGWWRGGWRYPLRVADPRITWEKGERREGPNETIGVLELAADGRCRAVFAERVEVDGRCHVRT